MPEPPEESEGLTPEVIHQGELEAQIPELAGFELRGRRVTFEPGGATSAHDHDERPGALYVLEGSVTEIRNGEPQVFSAGESWVEGTDANHWVLNHTDEDAVVIAIDVPEISPEDVEKLPKAGTKTTVEGEAPTEAEGVESEELGIFDIGEQIPGSEGIQLRMQRITIEPAGATENHTHAQQPGFGYVLEGELTEIRTKSGGTKKARTLAEGDGWSENADTEHWVTNATDEPVTFLAVDLVVEEG